jgi:membrane associated rhomboid family serine protease
MMIPIRTSYHRRRTPWVNYALVAANVLIFLAGYRGDTTAGRLRIETLMLHPDLPELSQFFSCMFLHATWKHLLGNMVFLWVFGNAVNDRLGHVGYLAFYLGGGLVAGVGYLLLSGNAPVLGASGAIAAVTGAYLVLLARTSVTLLFLLLYYPITVEVSSLFFILIQVVTDFFMTYQGWAGQATGGVAHAAHASGYAFGMLLAVVLRSVRLLVRSEDDLLSLIRHGFRRSSYRRMAARGFDPFGRSGPSRRAVASRVVETTGIDSPPARELELRRAIARALTDHDLPVAAGLYRDLDALADDPVLPRAQQLDIANQLMAEDRHRAAVAAYERFVRAYADYEHLDDIRLMLGLLYGRYVHQPEKAVQYLEQALPGLADPRKRALAEDVLAAVRHS